LRKGESKADGLFTAETQSTGHPLRLCDEHKKTGRVGEGAPGWGRD